VKIEGRGKALRIYIGESDTWHGRPLYQAIVRRLRAEGLAGATVLRGIEGFGAHSRLHTTRILRLSEDLPLVIEVVDREDRIRSTLPMLDEMVTEGLITLEDVEVLVYRAPEQTP
jgi:PII-like signaling protein